MFVDDYECTENPLSTRLEDLNLYLKSLKEDLVELCSVYTKEARLGQVFFFFKENLVKSPNNLRGQRIRKGW